MRVHGQAKAKDMLGWRKRGFHGTTMKEDAKGGIGSARERTIVAWTDGEKAHGEDEPR